MDDDSPATKGDLKQVSADLKQLRADLEQRIDQTNAGANHRCDDIVERISDSETRVVNAIYDLAKTGNKRMTHIEGDNAALNNRLATIEDRLLEVENAPTCPRRHNPGGQRISPVAWRAASMLSAGKRLR